MPSNNLLATNKNLQRDLDIQHGAFSMVQMSVPRMKSDLHNEDLPAPVEIYSRAGGVGPMGGGTFPRSGISETQSDFNSGVQSTLNRRAVEMRGAPGVGATSAMGGPGAPLQMCQSNYEGDMNAQTSYY